jgi:hypothetical protein
MADFQLPRLQKVVLSWCFILVLAACGGGGGTSDPGFIGGGATPPDEVSDAEVTLTLALTNSDGEPTTNITSTDPGRLDITATDTLTGEPYVGLVIAVTTSLGRIEPVSGTALTDDAGLATVFLISDDIIGAGTVQVTTTIDDVIFLESLSFSIGAAALVIGSIVDDVFTEGTIDAGAINLPTGGSTTLDVAVLDEDGELIDTVVQVSFGSGCAPATAQITSPVSTVGGLATSTYTATGCVGDDTVNAVILGSSTNSASVTLTIAPASVNSISFESATPTTLALKGTGGVGREETSIVEFKVLDDVGDPVSGEAVAFSLSTTIGGLALTNDSATTNENGVAQAIVQAGNVSTAVRVNASIAVDGVELTTVSDRLVVSTGLPDQNSFSMSVEIFNPGGGNINGISTPITVRMADKFNNPVPDGTTAVFTTEFGTIVSTCSTTDGICSVNWTSQAPRVPLFNADLIATVANRTCVTTGETGLPCPDDLGQTYGHRSTVLVTAIGEESFIDTNGNGLWDIGEAHEDLPEAFLDHNENGVYDGDDNCTANDTTAGRICASGLEETFVDFNVNGMYDGGNGIYNGTLCPVSLAELGLCSRQLISVRGQGIVVMSSTPSWILVDQAGNKLAPGGTGIPPLTADVNYTLYVADHFNNVPANGTAVDVTADACTVKQSSSVVGNTAAIGATAFDIRLQFNPDNEELLTGDMEITIGGITSFVSCDDAANPAPP